MEINFMILWKEKITDKTDMLSKVSKMISMIFPNTDKDKICFEEKDNIIHMLPYKISNNKDIIVYMKIECHYSEAKSARVLSLIKNKIYQGKHRADFSIICTYDEASLSYCCRLMNPLGKFERLLRELIYMITVKSLGANWAVTSFPKELIDNIKQKSKGRLKDSDIVELALEYLDYSEIFHYLFDERRFGDFDEELSDEKLETLSKDDIIHIIQKTRKDSLWNKLFIGNTNIIFLKDSMNNLREYRNSVMHHHSMDEEEFKKIQKELKNANKKLKIAIKELEERIYTKEELNAILPSLNNFINIISHVLSCVFDSKFINIIKTISENVEKVSQNIKSYNK